MIAKSMSLMARREFQASIRGKYRDASWTDKKIEKGSYMVRPVLQDKICCLTKRIMLPYIRPSNEVSALLALMESASILDLIKSSALIGP